MRRVSPDGYPLAQQGDAARRRPPKIVKPARQRELVNQLRSGWGISIRRNFRVLEMDTYFYPAMSMRRIATASGLKFGNVTYHYPSREELVRELLDAVIRSYEVEFDALVRAPGLSLREQLRRYCLLVLKDIRSKKTTRLFPELWALSNHDLFARERVQELYARARAPLLRIVAGMRPDLPSEEQEMITLFISSAMEGTTPFAGYEKPFHNNMALLADMSIQAFLGLVEGYQRQS